MTGIGELVVWGGAWVVGVPVVGEMGEYEFEELVGEGV